MLTSVPIILQYTTYKSHYNYPITWIFTISLCTHLFPYFTPKTAKTWYLIQHTKLDLHGHGIQKLIQEVAQYHVGQVLLPASLRNKSSLDILPPILPTMTTNGTNGSPADPSSKSVPLLTAEKAVTATPEVQDTSDFDMSTEEHLSTEQVAQIDNRLTTIELLATKNKLRLHDLARNQMDLASRVLSSERENVRG